MIEVNLIKVKTMNDDLLSINNLSVSFGGLVALQDFCLTLKGGEIAGLIGPNGAGKTTAFNVISGIYRPTGGTITFKGVEITKAKPEVIVRMGIGRTFQNIRLFKELTVIDNIRVAFFNDYKYNLMEALFHLGRFPSEEKMLTEKSMYILSLFNMSSQAHITAKNLPYGSQRRLEIIRAIATNPELLMLDEPAAGMNPKEIDELMDFIYWTKERFNLTILLIEHQMKMVMKICSMLKVLDFGITIAEGMPQEVYNNPQVIRAYLGDRSSFQGLND